MWTILIRKGENMKRIHRIGIVMLFMAVLLSIKYGGIPGDDHLFAEIVYLVFVVGGSACLLTE